MTSHKKMFGDKMKKLGKRYRAGEFRGMSWKDVVRTHMRAGSRSKRSSRRRSSRRSSRRSYAKFGRDTKKIVEQRK